jgi:hypothetical protein
MGSRSKQMRVVEDEIARKKEQLRKLQIEIAALEEVLARATGVKKPRAPRSDVKREVLRLLEEVGDRGLVAASAVEMAEKRGVRLERGTVSSLLSRLKHDGFVVYDGTSYRLPSSGAGEKPAENQLPAASVHPFPASKSAS